MSPANHSEPVHNHHQPTTHPLISHLISAILRSCAPLIAIPTHQKHPLHCSATSLVFDLCSSLFALLLLPFFFFWSSLFATASSALDTLSYYFPPYLPSTRGVSIYGLSASITIYFALLVIISSIMTDLNLYISPDSLGRGFVYTASRLWCI